MYIGDRLCEFISNSLLPTMCKIKDPGRNGSTGGLVSRHESRKQNKMRGKCAKKDKKRINMENVNKCIRYCKF